MLIKKQSSDLKDYLLIISPPVIIIKLLYNLNSNVSNAPRVYLLDK